MTQQTTAKQSCIAWKTQLINIPKGSYPYEAQQISAPFAYQARHPCIIDYIRFTL